MPRYLVERSFPDRWEVDTNAPGEAACSAVAVAHRLQGVTWLRSYVAADQKRSYCLVDAPSPEAVRLATAASCLPADRITEVRLLDPHFLV